jgi:hypothetical protein
MFEGLITFLNHLLFGELDREVENHNRRHILDKDDGDN